MASINRFRQALAAGALAALAFAAPAAAQDDTALFSTSVAPNVMLMVDNSGSMNEIMWHPNFNQAVSTCAIFGWVAPNSGGPTTGSGTLNGLPYTCDATYKDCRFELDNTVAGFTSTGTYTCPAGSPGGATKPIGYIQKTFCGKSRKLYVDPANLCMGNKTWWGEEYTEWYFSAPADAYLLNNESNTSNDVTKIDANQNGVHFINNQTFPLFKRARITAAKEIARDVIYQVDSNCPQGGGFPCPAGGNNRVRFGVAQFDSSDQAPGGFVRAAIDNYSTNATLLDSGIGGLDAQTSTPLAETLFKLYTYFMSRTTANRPFGKDGVTRFPKYSYALADGANTSSPPGDALSCPPSNTPCQCQKNFVILITDGEPTRDNFAFGTAGTNTTGRTLGFGDFVTKYIGDYNADGEVEQPAGTDGWLYLDDVAKYMQNNDFRPDLTGVQTIDIYTVGFATSGAANSLLQKTAAVGNGLFFTGTQAQDLTDALVNSIQSIILKSQAFTAATVPATRTSYGGKFYNSLFVPSDESGYWEGHLQSWTISEAGEILDKNGNCAFTGNPSPCFEGTFNPSAVPFWDAGSQVPIPASRNLATSQIVGSVASKLDFTQANIDDTMLGLAAGDAATYIYQPPATAPGTLATLADMVVENARGCKFGTGVGANACQQRVDNTGTAHRLGDIFHSNPVVVGRPLGFQPEPSYEQWSSPTTNPTVGLRKQVLLAGANDGFFRVFDAGSWSTALTPNRYDDGTGAEVAGFMPYTARLKAKYLAKDAGTRDYYFTDGSPTVADVWFYSNPTNSDPTLKASSEWHTVTVAGMRQGGNQYFALDITDPASTGYPQYLWEFPREDAAATVKQWMGETWSEPVIVKVRLAVNGDTANPQERWVAIVAGGYDKTGDPNNSAYSIHAKAGRSLTMLDVKTGRIIGQKAFVDTPAATDPAAVTYDAANPEKSMLYTIPSTPGVFDLDFDGYADVVYVGDTGGNMWKWVIHDVGHDPVNSASTATTQPAWHFEKFFNTPPYPAPPTAGPRHYRSFYFAPSATFKNSTLWLAFGSGERTDLKYAGLATPADENNRFYSVKDNDPLELNAATPLLCEPTTSSCTSTLLNLTGSLNTCSDLSSYDGFYITGADGEKFVTATDIFFYYVFVASFTPATTSNPCLTGGNATLYAFKTYCGEGLFEDAGGNPVATISLGDGMPTDPKVSLSGAQGGSRVFINKKDEVLSKDTGFTPDQQHGQSYWREVLQ